MEETVWFGWFVMRRDPINPDGHLYLATSWPIIGPIEPEWTPFPTNAWWFSALPQAESAMRAYRELGARIAYHELVRC